MQKRIIGLVIVIVCLLASGATASVPDQVTIVSSREWVVANGADTAVITVQVQNSSSSTSGLRVDFSTDPVYGQMTPLTGITDANGEVSSIFKAAQKSGIAPITVRIHYEDNEAWYTTEKTFLQGVDHDIPYGISYLNYLPEVAVGGTSVITVGLSDAHGNPIDNRNIAESVRFTVGSPSGNAEFEGAPSATSPVDQIGNASVSLQLDTIAGENIVLIEPPSPIPGRYITIYGLGNGVPSAISCAINSTPYLPADGVSKFHLTYTMSDQYGNPAGNRSVQITTSIGGEDRILTTNSLGQVRISYGPKDSTGTITLTATAVDNSSVTVDQVVEFYATDPVNMLLSASPQTMASRDVNPDIVASIRAKVMDIKGNPVAGESVSFSIIDANNGTYIQTDAPELVEEAALTDGDGYAIVGFRPGAFSTDRDQPGYDSMATGTCRVAAAWDSTTIEIPLAWKNYPYLSVETEVVPETVAVNDTIDVTIRLKGDGWALQPDPIDVVLVLDRSGSMLYDTPQRIVSAKSAANNFVDQMSPDRDRVALVSFASSTTIDQSLTNDFSGIKSKISAIRATGATQLRRATYEGINDAIKGDPDAIRAVILMTDGDWNYDGSPLGHGTGWPSNASGAYTFSGSTFEPDDYRWYDGLGGTLFKPRFSSYYRCTDGEDTNQNMAIYAKNNNVRLYTISFAATLNPTAVDALQYMANTTGGFYEHAPDGEKLADIYTRIAGELKTEAGVNTGMDAVFENVEVNGAPIAGDQVFDYVYADNPPTSTRILSYNSTATIIPVYARDDTDSWIGEQAIHFDIGTIRLNQVWETTFRFKVLKDGNINIFGPGSVISFNDGADTLTLPDTFVTAVHNLNNTGVNFTELAISNFHCTNLDSATDFLNFAWNLEYTGTETVTEEVFYSNDGGLSWVVFDTRYCDPEAPGDSTGLDMRSLPGGQYHIRVHAFAPDAPDDREELEVDWQANDNYRNYIRIQ